MADACELEIPQTLFAFNKSSDKLIEVLRWANVMSGPIKTAPWREVDVGGTGLAYIMVPFWTEEIAVSINSASAGVEFPHHQHPGFETFHVYEGLLQLHYDGRKIDIAEGGKPYWFDAHFEHWAHFPRLTRYIAITAPGDEDWLVRG